MHPVLKSLIAGFCAALIMAGGALAAPAMWKVSDGDSEVWLFGSIHVLDETTEWRTPLLEEVLNKAQIIYYEAFMGEEAQAQVQESTLALGFNPEGVTLTSLLESDDKELLEKTAQNYGTDMAELENLRPALASMVLATKAIMKSGYDPKNGVDKQLSAETPDLKERYFESLEKQLLMLADLPQDAQIEMLVSGLHQLEAGPEFFHTLIENWQMGDVDELEEILNEDVEDDAPEVYDALFRKRNEAWAEELSTLMAGDEDALIVVGTAHLVGNDSVPELLEERGLTVERVQ